MNDAPLQSPRRISRVAWLFLVVAVAGGWAASVRAEETGWIKLTAPQFTVISQGSESRTRAWASDFELFHRGISSLLMVPVDRLEPLRIVLFGSDRRFRPFKPLADGKPALVGGIFLRNPGRNIAAVSLEGDRSDGRERIFHEATHWHLAAFERDIPVWLNEGLAELFANFELEGDQFKIGLNRPGELLFVHRFGPLPLKQLAAVDEEALAYDWKHAGETAKFYAQSWAAVHLLVIGSPNGMYRLRTYLSSPPSDVDPGEDLLRNFGLTENQFDQRVADYLMRHRLSALTVPLDRRGVGRDFVIQPATEGDVALALGELLVGESRPSEAEPYLMRAVAALPSDPAPHECLGMVDIATQRDREARDEFKRALALGSESAVVFYYAAISEWTDCFQAEPENVPSLEHAAGNLATALDLDPRFSSAYEAAGLMLGATTDAEVCHRLERYLREGARRYPATGGVQVGLGYLALRSGDVARARICAERARAARSAMPEIVITLQQRLIAAIARASEVLPPH